MKTCGHQDSVKMTVKHIVNEKKMIRTVLTEMKKEITFLLELYSLALFSVIGNQEIIFRI